MDVAADPFELIDQRLALGVARVNDENARPAKFFDQAADAGFHAITASSLSQRPPMGDTDR